MLAVTRPQFSTAGAEESKEAGAPPKRSADPGENSAVLPGAERRSHWRRTRMAEIGGEHTPEVWSACGTLAEVHAPNSVAGTIDASLADGYAQAQCSNNTNCPAPGI